VTKDFQPCVTLLSFVPASVISKKLADFSAFSTHRVLSLSS
jgi:hypothetical protein